MAPKKKSNSIMDGLVSDLFKRVYIPLDSSPNLDRLDDIRSIHRILAQIQKHERHLSSNVKPTSGESRMNHLVQWLKQNDQHVEGIEFASGLEEGGGGVVATRPLKEGEILAKIPKDLMMSTLSAMEAKDDVALLCANDPWLRQMPSLILSMHLLFEKHKSNGVSKWEGYIKSLPGQHCLQENNVDGPEDILLPLSFSMPTIETLRGTTALIEFHKMLRNIAKQYCHMYLMLQRTKNVSSEIARSSSWFSYAQFRWAASIVMMRQNQIPIASEDTSKPLDTFMALVPVLDMFNHEEGPITCHYDVSAQSMEVKSKREFELGQQVFISYGIRPNVMMFLYSGFIPQVNSYDRIRLTLELPPSDSLYSKKIALLKWLELPPKGDLDLFFDGSPSQELVTFIKVLCAHDQTFLTNAMRSIISLRTQEMTQALGRMPSADAEGPLPSKGGERQEAKGEEGGPDVADPEANGSDPNRVAFKAVQVLADRIKSSGGDRVGDREYVALTDDSFSIDHWDKLRSVCKSRLDEILHKGSGAGAQGKGEGRGGGGGGASKEMAMACRIREIEIEALERAMEIAGHQVSALQNGHG